MSQMGLNTASDDRPTEASVTTGSTAPRWFGWTEFKLGLLVHIRASSCFTHSAGSIFTLITSVSSFCDVIISLLEHHIFAPVNEDVEIKRRINWSVIIPSESCLAAEPWSARSLNPV